MTEFKLANLDKWAAQTTKRLDAVVKQATNDTIRQASRTATGKTRGGTLKKGYVPRDTGILAGSLVSTLHGGTMLTGAGEDSYRLVVGSMKAGDVARFAWTADYAAHVHFGTSRQPGWFWIDEAANNWPQIVDAAVRRAKARVGP